MATVKITATLIDAIGAGVRRSFEPRVLAVRDKIVNSDIYTRAFRAVYEPWIPTLDKLPNGLRDAHAPSEVNIIVKLDKPPISERLYGDVKVNFPYTLTKNAGFYRGTLLDPTHFRWQIRKPDNASPTQMAIYNEYHKLTEALTEVYEQRHSVMTTIDKLMQSQSTLNAAVKLWKPLLSFVPQEYIDRLERKAAPRAKKVECEALDISDLNAAASIVIANKLGV